MPYGEDWLNPHNALKYGWVRDFINTFGSIRYDGIKIPDLLVRFFQIYIRDLVNQNLKNKKLLRSLRAKYRMNTMAQVQRSLSKGPSLVRDLSKYPHRNTILMPGRLVQLALKQFRKNNIIFVIYGKQDRDALSGLKLPKNFDRFDIWIALRRAKLTAAMKTKLLKQIDRILANKSVRKHPVFSRPNFRNWLFNRSLFAIRINMALRRLVKKHPIGMIVDYSEIVNPGLTLSMIARQYKIPFVLVPLVMTSDHVFIPSRATYYCAFGVLYKRWMIRRGIPRNRISVTGSVQFENVLSEPPSIRSKGQLMWAHGRRFIHSRTLIVTYTTQPYHENVQKDVMTWINAVCKQPIPILFIIRPHPSDPFPYSKYVESSKIVISPKTIKLYDVLRNSDLIMTISSNTAIEAAMFRKGIIVAQPPMPYDFDKNYNRYRAHLAYAKAGPVVRNSQELTSTVREIWENEELLQEAQNQARSFLELSLQTKESPSLLTAKLIRHLLRKKRKRMMNRKRALARGRARARKRKLKRR